MPMPIENCAKATAGIEASAPTMRAFERNRIPKVFIRNRLSSTLVCGTKGSGIIFSVTQCTTRRNLLEFLPPRSCLAAFCSSTAFRYNWAMSASAAVTIAPSPTSYGQVARKLAGRAAAGVLVLFCLVSSLTLAAQQLSHLFLFSDVGYVDNYILYDVLHFQRTGEIYRDLSQPPYLPAQYSPMVYMLYSLPGRIAPGGQNPFLGPRLLALAVFLMCVGVVVSIVRTLVPVRLAWLWGMLLAGSVSSLRIWVLQLRGDFPAIFFSMLAVRLLLVRSRWAVILAGACAGFATQFKLTYVAALAAGSLWLLLRRQWKELAGFILAGALTSGGLYLVFWLREPRMISQILALSPGIMEVRGWLGLMYTTLREPIVLLAVAALPPIAWWAWPRWGLVFLFALTSFAIAGLTSLQAGANINYFFEGLLALTAPAVLGMFRLTVWARQHLGAALFLAALFAIHFLPPSAHDLYWALRAGITPHSAESRNQAFLTMQDSLRGRHIFSTVPRLALLDPDPPLMEPFLLSYLQRLEKFDPRPILDRIRSDEFEIVITSDHPEIYRGVPHVGPDLGVAIEASYTPYCALLGSEIYLPRNRVQNADLVRNLKEIGCVPIGSAN